ncbi:MAG: biotin/lipoyl-containing protein, partial [Micropruina sp.]
MKEFRLPDPGEGLVEAEIVTWLVAEGDVVKVNDILLEIETSKSLVELPSPFAGTVAKLLVPAGTTVEVGTPIILIDDGSAAEVAPDPVEVARLEGDEEPEAMLVGYGAKSSAVARRPRKGVATRGGPVADQVHESYGVENPVSRPTDATTSLPPLTAEPAGEPLPEPGVLPPPAPGSK